jgi:hypothetical protein
MCEEPPQRKKSTVDFAGFARVGAATDEPVVALDTPLKPRDAKPIVEAVRKARRSMEERNSGVCMGSVAGSYAAFSASLSPGLKLRGRQ